MKKIECPWLPECLLYILEPRGKVGADHHLVGLPVEAARQAGPALLADQVAEQAHGAATPLQRIQQQADQRRALHSRHDQLFTRSPFLILILGHRTFFQAS